MNGVDATSDGTFSVSTDANCIDHVVAILLLLKVEAYKV